MELGNDIRTTKSSGDKAGTRTAGLRTVGLLAAGASEELSAELAELVEIAAVRARLDAREAALLADPTVGEHCLTETGHRTPQWLASETRISSYAASLRVRIAQRIHTHFQPLVAALQDGRVGWNHVVVFNRAANPRIRVQMAELLDSIIALAQVATFERWSQEVRGIAEQLDQDGGYDPAQDPASNWLKLTPTFEGAVDISGRLVGELAFRISKLIEAETDRVQARHRSDAEQLAATSPAAESIRSDSELLPPSRAQACAEALGELVERAWGTPDGEGKMPTPELVVTLDSETGQLRSDDGEVLSHTILRWLLAAAIIRPLEMTHTGDPLRMGRALRYANRDQRRALALRDGGCVFPGCNRPPAWCDAHHVDHWDQGGDTDIEAMALLCRHHHRVTHQPRWVMETTAGPNGEVLFEWTTPGGRRLRSQRNGIKRHQTASGTAPPTDRQL